MRVLIRTCCIFLYYVLTCLFFPCVAQYNEEQTKRAVAQSSKMMETGPVVTKLSAEDDVDSPMEEVVVGDVKEMEGM